jgi:hypothetical protein
VIAYLQLFALVALAAGVLKLNRRIHRMNQDEKNAFDNLTAAVKRLETSHHDLAVENAALKTTLAGVELENDALKAQLAAVPPPVPDDSAEVIAAANALTSEVNAELSPPAPAPAETPAAS